jgi:hypothetical protein
MTSLLLLNLQDAINELLGRRAGTACNYILRVTYLPEMVCRPERANP